MNEILNTLRQEVQNELEGNILPFWMNRMTDHERGGFYGRMSGENELFPEASKGAVLNARILWTFSAAYRLLGKEKYLETATRAKRYLLDCFYDRQFGGIYWELDACGRPLDTKKQIYALGFAIYGLSVGSGERSSALRYSAPAAGILISCDLFSVDQEIYCGALL